MQFPKHTSHSTPLLLRLPLLGMPFFFFPEKPLLSLKPSLDFSPFLPHGQYLQYLLLLFLMFTRKYLLRIYLVPGPGDPGDTAVNKINMDPDFKEEFIIPPVSPEAAFYLLTTALNTTRVKNHLGNTEFMWPYVHPPHCLHTYHSKECIYLSISHPSCKLLLTSHYPNPNRQGLPQLALPHFSSVPSKYSLP